MTVETEVERPAARPVRVGARVVWTLAAAHAVAVFAQAVFAGEFLGGDYDMLGIHAAGADVVSYLGYALLLSAVVLWVLGGPRWPAAAAAVLVAAETGQYLAGLAGELALHVPLGVVVVAGGLVLLVALSCRRDAARGRR